MEVTLVSLLHRMASAIYARACHCATAAACSSKEHILFLSKEHKSWWWKHWGREWCGLELDQRGRVSAGTGYPAGSTGATALSCRNSASATGANSNKQGFRTNSLLHSPGHWTGLTEGKIFYAKWQRVFHCCALVKAGSLSEANLQPGFQPHTPQAVNQQFSACGFTFKWCLLYTLFESQL